MINFNRKIIKTLSNKYATLRETIVNKDSLSKKVSLILILAMLIILFFMIYLIRYRGVLQTDIFLSRDLQAEGDTFFRKQAIFYLFNAISFFGKPIIATVMIIITALVFYCLKYYLESIFILLTSLSAAINWLVKLAVHRPRPNSSLIQILSYEGGYSFPSGHVTFYTVFFGFLFDIFPEQSFFKYSGIIRKQAKKQTNKVSFQRMSGITNGLESVVQLAHEFGSFDVYRVFFFISAFLVTGNEAKQMNIANKVF